MPGHVIADKDLLAAYAIRAQADRKVRIALIAAAVIALALLAAFMLPTPGKIVGY